MSAPTKAKLLLLIAVCLWGISGPIGKQTLAFIPTSILLAIRFGIISLLTALLAKFYYKQPLLPKNNKSKFLTSMLILGLFGTIGQIGLIYWGLNYTTSIDTTLLVSTSPIIVAIASHFFIKEHLTTKKIIGIILGVLGSAIIIINPLIQSGHLFSGSNYGNLLILLANCCWAVYAISSKKLLKTKVSAQILTFWMFFIGSIFMSLISIPQLPKFLTTIPHVPLAINYYLLYLGIGPGLISYLCYNHALKYIAPTDADLFNYLSPLIAIPIGFFWLHEPITLSFGIGGIIIAIGVFTAEFSGRKRR